MRFDSLAGYFFKIPLKFTPNVRVTYQNVTIISISDLMLISSFESANSILPKSLLESAILHLNVGVSFRHLGGNSSRSVTCLCVKECT